MLWWALLGCGPRPESYTELKAACEAAESGVVCFADESATCVDGKIEAFDACDHASQVCADGVGCEACPLDVSVQKLSAAVVPPGSSEEMLTLSRVPLGLTTDPAANGTVTLTALGEVSVWRPDGAAVALPFRFEAADLPELFATVSSPSGGVLTATFSNGIENCAEKTIAIAGVPFPGLAGKSLASAPGFEWVDTFHDGQPVAVAVSTSALSGPAQVAITPHRDAASWLADPAIVPVVPPVTLRKSEGALSSVVAWDAASVAEGELDTAFDVVLDRDGDGALGPGDWLDGGDRPGFWAIADLTGPGPHAVTTAGASADFWRTQRIYYPADIASLGELPVVLISHGNGHDYTWYDYLGEHLASWGFVVASHRNNTEPGIETASTTTLDNTDWLLSSEDTVLDGALAGHLDGHRVGWIGHSRGGEGVVRAYDRVLEGDYAPDAFTAEDVRVISSIAPTVFLGPTESDPHDVTYHLLYGAADGDVSGAASCDVCQSFHLSSRGTGEVQTTYVQGASHNDFNCCGFDDATGPDLIGRDDAQLVAKSTLLALFALHLQDRQAMREVLTRMYEDVRPPGVPADIVISSTWRPARGEEQLVLDDFEANEGDGTSSSGGTVTFDVANLDEDDLDDADLKFAWTDLDPMNGMTQTEAAGLVLDHGVMFDWTTGMTPSLDYEVPAGEGDFSGGGYLQLRAAEGTRHPETVALDGPLSFTVALVDRAGVEAGIDFAAYGRLTRPYQRAREGEGRGWQNEFSTVRIRLTDFLVDAPDLDLADIATVRLRFGAGYGSERGRIGIDDLAVVE